MSQSKEPFDAFLQWEGLQFPRTLIRLEPSEGLLKGSASATISRDESYCLRCEVEGSSSVFMGPTLEFQNTKAGPFSIRGEYNAYNVLLSHCYVLGVRGAPINDPDCTKERPFWSDVHVQRVEQVCKGTWSKTTHIDWFLNGPEDFVFTDRTFNQYENAYLRRLKSKPEYCISCGSSLPGIEVGCTLVELPLFSFVIRKMPEEFGPAWSIKLGIEYSQKLSPIPDENTRTMVAELVSFILGRRLIDVGDTSLGNDGIPINITSWSKNSFQAPIQIIPDRPFRLRSWNPSGLNVRKLCGGIDFPPVPIDFLHWNNCERLGPVVSKLLPVYLKLRNTLSLDHALWKYWTFQELPLGVNLPILFNAFEILKDAWFRSPFSMSKGNFVSREKFQELLGEDFDKIRKKLVQACEGNANQGYLQESKKVGALMARLTNSFEMGSNAKMKQFFNEIGIEPSETEREAMRVRNQQIHGIGEAEQPEKLWQLSESLRTLFYKTVLRLLNYTGVYFDWSVRKPEPKQLPEFHHNGNYIEAIKSNS